MSQQIFDKNQYIILAKENGFTEQQATFQAEQINNLLDKEMINKSLLKIFELYLKSFVKELENLIKKESRESLSYTKHKLRLNKNNIIKFIVLMSIIQTGLIFLILVLIEYM